MKCGVAVVIGSFCLAFGAQAQPGLPVQVSHPTGAASDGFGSSIAIDGDTMVVGSAGDDVGSNTDQGSAQVYRWSGSTWTFEATLTANDGGAGDGFGTSVAISGDTIIVGAPFGDVGADTSAGTVHIFTRMGTQWSRQAKIVAAGGSTAAAFGSAVSIKAETALIGAPADTSNKGAAYVFTRSTTSWTQRSRITAADGAAGDRFGSSVAVDLDTAAIGAPLDDINANADQGSAYVYARNGTNWTLSTKLIATNGSSADQFGSSISVSGQRIALGAPGCDVNGSIDQGTAYVFVQSEGSWIEEVRCQSPYGGAGDSFGAAIAIDGDTVVIGAWADDVTLPADHGSMFIFSRRSGTWDTGERLSPPDSASGDRFGFSVSISSGIAVAAAPGDDVNGVADRGSAWTFTRIGGDWIRPASALEFTANDIGGSYYFGREVVVDGNLAFIAAPTANAVYVFQRDGANWTQQSKIVPNDPEAGMGFGTSIAAANGVLIVGAPYANGAQRSQQGAVYSFVKNGNTWSQEAKLTATSGQRFGSSVSMLGSLLAIGSPEDLELINPQTNSFASTGAVYLYTRNANAWSAPVRVLRPLINGNRSVRFGSNVALASSTLVIVAQDQSDYSGSQRQGVFAFNYSGGQWTMQSQAISAFGSVYPSGGSGGFCILAKGQTVIVGGGYNLVGYYNKYYVKIYEQDGSGWRMASTIESPSTNDAFGYALSFDGSNLCIGAPATYIPGSGMSNAGSVFRYVKRQAGWQFIEQKFAPSPQDGAQFGLSIATTDDVLLVGAFMRTLNGASYGGSVTASTLGRTEVATTVRNDSTNTNYASLATAMLAAQNGQQISASEAAWSAMGSINSLGRSLALTGTGDIRTPSTSALELGQSSLLATPTGSEIEMFGQFRIASGGSVDVSTDRFHLGARGLLTSRLSSSLSVSAPISKLDGATRIEQGSSISFFGSVESYGTTTAFQNTSVSSGGPWLNVDTFSISDGILGIPVFHNRTNANLFGTNALFGSLINDSSAITVIRSGTLYVYGSLNNNGSIIGSICSNCTSTPPNMDIGGNLIIGAESNLLMPFFGATVRVGGDFDCAINSNDRFSMNLATLELEGSGTEQTLEAMSSDVDIDPAGLDASLPGAYPIHTLHIGPAPSVVTLVDAHDNDNAGQVVPEAIYVDTLRIDPGSRLNNQNITIYYNTLRNSGTIDDPTRVIRMTPAPYCPADFNLDGAVDGDDVISFVAQWDIGDSQADFNSDGAVDGDDLIGFFEYWDTGC